MPFRDVHNQSTVRSQRWHTRIRRSIVCLLSALHLHDLTTQSPFEVWLAIPNKSRAPIIDYPSLRIVRFSGVALTEGIDEHQIDAVTVRVTNIARTVADCFKFRNKIGLHVALEARKRQWREKRVIMDEPWHYAAVCRMTNVMRPYMESLLKHRHCKKLLKLRLSFCSWF